MPKFIDVTDSLNVGTHKVSINTAEISEIRPEGDGSQIVMRNGRVYMTKETPSTLKMMVADSEAPVDLGL